MLNPLKDQKGNIRTVDKEREVEVNRKKRGLLPDQRSEKTVFTASEVVIIIIHPAIEITTIIMIKIDTVRTIEVAAISIPKGTKLPLKEMAALIKCP